MVLVNMRVRRLVVAVVWLLGDRVQATLPGEARRRNVAMHVQSAQYEYAMHEHSEVTSCFLCGPRASVLAEWGNSCIDHLMPISLYVLFQSRSCVYSHCCKWGKK